MSFWRPDIHWNDRLHWCERLGMIVWWFGQAAFAASVLISVWLVGAALYSPLPSMTNATVLESLMATLLVGAVILIATRIILGLAMGVGNARGR